MGRVRGASTSACPACPRELDGPAHPPPLGLPPRHGLAQRPGAEEGRHLGSPERARPRRRHRRPGQPPARRRRPRPRARRGCSRATGLRRAREPRRRRHARPLQPPGGPERGRGAASSSSTSRELLEVEGVRVQVVGGDPAPCAAEPHRSARRSRRRPPHSPRATSRTSMRRLAPGDFDLVLAGHLHGGQICIPTPRGKAAARASACARWEGSSSCRRACSTSRAAWGRASSPSASSPGPRRRSSRCERPSRLGRNGLPPLAGDAGVARPCAAVVRRTASSGSRAEGGRRRRAVGRARRGGLGRLGDALLRGGRPPRRIRPVRAGSPVPARERAARRPAVARRRPRHVRLSRRPLRAVGDAEPLPRSHRRGARPGHQGDRDVRLPLSGGRDGYERVFVHRTVFPSDFLADFGFVARRWEGDVASRASSWAGCSRSRTRSTSRALRRVKEAFTPAPVPQRP